MKTLLAFVSCALICGAALLLAPRAQAQTYSAATVGTSAANVSASPTTFLDLVNNSATATICINFSGTATIATAVCAAGEITLPPLYHRSWENGYFPRGTISAIASGASTPMSVGVR